MAKEPAKGQDEEEMEAQVSKSQADTKNSEEAAANDEDNEGMDDELHKSSDEVPVSEEFQKHAHKLTHKASKHHLQHLRSMINEREDALREEEQAEGEEAPKEFSMHGAPDGV